MIHTIEDVPKKIKDKKTKTIYKLNNFLKLNMPCKILSTYIIMNISASLRRSVYGFNNTLGTIQVIHSLCLARRILRPRRSLMNFLILF